MSRSRYGRAKRLFIPFQMHFIPFEPQKSALAVDCSHSQQDRRQESRGEQKGA